MENDIPPSNKHDKMLLNVIRNQSKEMSATMELIGGLSKAVSAFAEYGRKNFAAYEEQRQDYERRLNTGLAATDDYNEKIIFLKKESIELQKIILHKKTTRYVGDAKFYTSVREQLVLPLLAIIEEEAKLAIHVTLTKPASHTPTADHIFHFTAPAVKTPKVILPKVNSTGIAKNIKNETGFGLSWNIDPKMKTAIVDLLIAEKCFRPDDRFELLNIFHNEKRAHSHKIVCRGLQKRFPTIIFELEKKDKIQSQKKEISAWIVENFAYQSSPEKPSQDFSLSSVSDALNESKPKKRIPKGHSQYIDVLDLFA